MTTKSYKNILTSIFALTVIFAVIPAFAAVEEDREREANRQQQTKTIMLPSAENGSKSKLSDEELKKCDIKTSDEACLKIDDKNTNPIKYTIDKNADRKEPCKNAKITVECSGYKKLEITYLGAVAAPLPDVTLEKSNKVFQKIGDGFVKGGQAIGKGATTAWNATSNFVSGIFKGAEPCSEAADKALKATDTNIEKTKLDTKQEGTDGKDGAKGKCVVSKCVKNYVPNDAKSGCEQSGGPCPAADIEKVPNATAGELKKGSCYITECGNGYHPSDDGQSCEQAELSEEDSKNKVSELKANAQKMKDKEQSTANKMLGAAAIGATGIGGMNLMSGMAEQKADDSAEEDMKAYLATFVCDYGQGRNIKGGERDIDLPGGNELFDEVNEYKALAADLKIRKEALGKTPGIEAEVIYDIAETGLYDNVGMGRQSGAYASLSKALMDENSEDAKAWAEQKADTKSKIKTGAITAGAGAIGGLVGNLAINSGEKNKNQVDKIISDYDKKKQAIRTIQEKVDREPETTTSCSDYTYNNAALTGNYPDCNCGDKAYFKPDHSENDKLVGCIPCIGDTVPNTEKTQCICTNGRTPDANGICPSDSNPCTLSGDFVNNADGKCECIAPATPNDTETGCICDNTKNNYKDATGNCVYCNPATHTLNGNECAEKPEGRQLTPIIIKSDKFFNLSKATFKSNTDAFWTEFANEIQQIAPTDYANYNVCITGQTDPSTFGRNSRKNNEDLSAARAYTVFNEIKDKGFKSIKYKGAGAVQVADTVESIGDSSKICNPARTAKSTWGNCRRVLITISADECPSGFIDSAEEPSFYNLYK